MKLVICDFDGMLLPDKGELSYQAFKTQVPELTLDEYLSWFDGNVHVSVAARGVAEHLPAFFADYARAIAPLTMGGDLRAVIEELGQHFPLAIISSNSADTIRTYLKRSGVQRSFRHILGHEEHASKVAKFELLCSLYKVCPSDCFFVTDTLGDIREATVVGMPCIGVTWGFHSRERLAPGRPTAIVDTPSELLALLLKK